MSQSFTNMEFRQALGSFATGVTIITTLGKGGQKVGMTANSFNSVSLDPPLVLWSLGRDTNCFDDFIAAESFAIHVLASDQQDLSTSFAKIGKRPIFRCRMLRRPVREYLFCRTTAPVFSAPWDNSTMVGIMLLSLER